MPPYSKQEHIVHLLQETRNIRLLTKNEETQLAHEIYDGQLELLHCLLDFPESLPRLQHLFEQIEAGHISISQILRIPQTVQSDGQVCEPYKQRIHEAADCIRHITKTQPPEGPEERQNGHWLQAKQEVFQMIKFLNLKPCVLSAVVNSLKKILYGVPNDDSEHAIPLNGSAQPDTLADQSSSCPHKSIEENLDITNDFSKQLHCSQQQRTKRRWSAGENDQQKVSHGRHHEILKAMEQAERKVQFAKDRFVKSNIRLVVSIAGRYMNRGLEFGDLIQEGTMGLMRAVEKFDSQQDTKFSTYATHWIHQRMQRAVLDQARDIRIPYYMLDRIRKLDRRRIHLAQEENRVPTFGEIEDVIGLSIAESASILNASLAPAHLDASVFEDDDSPLHEVIGDAQTVSPIEVYSRKQQKDRIAQILKTLTPKEEIIIRKRFGIGEETTYTLEEIGQFLGLTRERIRQIEERALQKLRQGKVRNSLWELASN